MMDFRAILERDNAEGAAEGLDGFGLPLEPVTYRPNPNKVKPTDYTIRVNDNLTSSWYRELEGPPLSPRGPYSRVTKNFRTSHMKEPGAWVAIGGWEEFVSIAGEPILPFHREGQGNLPVRNLIHIRPRAMARAKEALHDFAVKLISRIRGR
jgi:hypothetical protein